MSGRSTRQSFWTGLVARYWFVILIIAAITAAHYGTDHSTAFKHAMHGIYRRLYYFPIILAAFRGGRRGGLFASVLVVGLYVPHAVGLIGHDPGTPAEKTLEMLLYLAVGVLTGTLVGHLKAAEARLRTTAEDLQAALDEKTAMEAELVRTERLAAVGRLSAGLAHEIRNPLASIRGTAEVLGDDFPADHPKGGLFRILLEETGRLNEVLTRFLAFARAEPGERIAFDLAAEARDVQQLLAHQPDSATITVNGPAALVVAANREQVRQVLLNLAVNAAAAAGPSGHVTIEVAHRDGRAVCRVCDDGPGFTSEAAANFGTPFYSTREGGTGLGLAISLRIAEDQGGSLVLDRAGPGGCVQLTLPLAPDA